MEFGRSTEKAQEGKGLSGLEWWMMRSGLKREKLKLGFGVVQTVK